MNCWVEPAAIFAVEGITLMAVGTLGVMVSDTDPFTSPMEAFTAPDPGAMPLATPEELIATTPGFVEIHVTVEVTFSVEASLYVAVAENCCVPPTGILADAGEICIAVMVLVAAAIFMLADAVPVIPFWDAFTVVIPAPIPLNNPDAVILPKAGFVTDQAALLVRSAVVPSL